MASTSAPIPWCGFDEFHVKLIEFLRERSMETLVPLKLRKLCTDFQKESQVNLAIAQLLHRARLVKERIHEVKEFDMETRTRMLFALSVPVDMYFAAEIREQKNVILELDNRNRISKYENGGGINLSGVHTGVGFRAVSDKDHNIQNQMMEYLAERSMKVNVPLPTKTFLDDFKRQFFEKDSLARLWRRYDAVKSSISTATKYDLNMRIKMMFVSGAKLPERLLRELQTHATIRVDGKNRIIEYTPHGGTFSLKGDHMNYGRRKSVQEEFENTEIEDDAPEEEEFQEFDSSSMIVPKREESEERQIRKRTAVEEVPGVSAIKRECNEQQDSTNYLDQTLPQTSSAAGIESRSSEPLDVISCKAVMTAIKNLIYSLDSPPFLDEVLLKIEETLMTGGEEKIPTEALKLVLISSLGIGSCFAVENDVTEDSKNYREFLLLYRCTVYNLNRIGQLEEIQRKISECIENAANKRLPAKGIRKMIENVLAVVT
ncbi:unnamed protein product [Caenorhabditis nigoni]